MTIAKQLRPLLLFGLLAGLAFMTALAAQPAAEVTVDDVRSSEISAEAVPSGVKSKTELMERALRQASLMGEVTIRSAAEMDATQAVYTTAATWERVVNGDPEPPSREAMTSEFYMRPLFAVRVDGSNFRAMGMPAPPESKAAEAVYTTLIQLMYADTGDIIEWGWYTRDSVNIPDLSTLSDTSLLDQASDAPVPLPPAP
jgi:hypothetical protein